MIVTDSAVLRQLLGQALAEDIGIRVIACAADRLLALDKLRGLSPDVLSHAAAPHSLSPEGQRMVNAGNWRPAATHAERPSGKRLH